MKPTKRWYSVTFDFLLDGAWVTTRDHRCQATDAKAAVRHWRQAGYGEIRNATAVEIG